METSVIGLIIFVLTVNHLQYSRALDECIPYDAKEYIPFDFVNDALINSTLSANIVSTNGGTSAAKVSVITESALQLSSSDYIDLEFTSDDRSRCLHSPDVCASGFSLHLALKLSPDISTDKYYLSNGGQTSTSYGMSIAIIGSVLKVRVTTEQQEWEVQDTESTRVKNNGGYFVGVTWDRSTLNLYEKGSLIDSLLEPVNRTSFVPLQDDFFFGKSTSATTTGEGSYDEFIFWEEVKPASYFKDLYTAQSTSTCVVKCEDKSGTTDFFHSCDACNLYWDCHSGSGQRKVCRSGYTFDSSLKDCTATATTCPSTVIRNVATDELTCFPVPCSMDPCENNGRCSDEPDGWLCHCNLTAPGWEGDRCELNIDECLETPCVINNTDECVDGIGGLSNYTCVCLPGYNLTHCENYDNCLDDPCENGATCFDDITADNFTCDCVPGYKGYNCSIDINECEVDNCENGAICNDFINMYNCTCPPGYNGFHCEFYDDCYFDPCVNGTCSDVNQTVYDDYTCDCQTGFIGKNCSNEQECITQNVTCQNGGTCVDLEGDWECECVPGFTDQYCETDIDECEPEPCDNNAACTDLINDYNCTCIPGFIDKNCSTDFDECASGPCQNDATCNDFVNEYNCTCSFGYNGTHCELYDDCSPEPCQHGGTCGDLDLENTGNHVCACVEGYWEDNCEYNNGCVTEAVICQNAGTCRNTTQSGEFQCDCGDGYDGIYCENDIDECASNPCQNGGVCEDQVNMYLCNCTAGFSLTDCSFEHKCQTQNVVCRNNGTCVDVTGTCMCPVANTGDTCQLDNPCLPNPCAYLEMESGTCNILDNVGSYNCSCNAGYSGQHCEVSPCSSGPCQNGATCVLDGDSFTCACLDGFTGVLCHLDDPTAEAQTGEETSSWQSASISLIVILVIVIAAVLIVSAVVVYKYKNRHNKISPSDGENHMVEDKKDEDCPIAPFQNGGSVDPWEGRDVEFKPSNETATATFDGGEGSANNGGTEGVATTAAAIPAKPKQPKPIDGPVVSGFSPPPKYEGPTVVETPAIESHA